MRRGLPSFVLPCFLGGIVCLALIPLIAVWHDHFFKRHERGFQSPLSARQMRVRSDSYGKGHFGAPRNGGRKHEGLDLLAPEGAAIVAPKSGRVLRAGYEKGYGLFTEIRHANQVTTRYAHLSVLHVRRGDWVKQNRVLGLSGRSGNAKNPSIKPHLHFEIRLNDTPQDPRPLLDL